MMVFYFLYLRGAGEQGAPLRLSGGSSELQHRQKRGEHAGALLRLLLASRFRPFRVPTLLLRSGNTSSSSSDRSAKQRRLHPAKTPSPSLTRPISLISAPQFGLYRQHLERNAVASAATAVADFGDLSYLLARVSTGRPEENREYPPMTQPLCPPHPNQV